MKILKLITKNFKRLGSRTIDFTYGLNAVTGPNGFGKTTLTEAVLLAWYGSNHVRGKADSIKTRDAEGSWKVEVHHLQAGHTFITTATSSTSTVVKIDKDTGEESTVATGRSDVTAYISSVIGDADSFKLLHVVGQKEAAHIAKSGGIELQRKVERLTGADVLERVLDWTKRQIQDADAIIGHHGDAANTIEDDIKLLKETLSTLQGKERSLKVDIDYKKNHVADAQERKDEAYRQLRAKEAVLGEWRTKQAAVVRIRDELNRLMDSSDDLRIRIESHPIPPAANMEEAARIENGLLDVQNRIDQAELDLRQWEDMDNLWAKWLADKSRMEGVVEGLKDRISGVEVSDRDYDAEIAQASDLVNKLNKEYESARYDAENSFKMADTLKKDMEHLKSRIDGTHCPTCRQVMPDRSEQEISHLKADLKVKFFDYEAYIQGGESFQSESLDKYSKVRQADAMLHKIKSERDDNEEKVNRLAKLEAQLSEAEINLQGIVDSEPPARTERPDVGHLYNERTELQTQMNAISRTRDERDSAIRHQEQLKELLAANEEKVAVKKGELRAIGELEDQPTTDREEQAHTDAVAQLSSFTDQLNGLTSDLRVVEVELRSAEGKVSDLEAVVAKLAEVKRRRSRLNALTTYVKERRTRYLASVWGSITAEASRIASSITEGIVNAEGHSTELNDIERDGNSFTCTEGGHRVSISELSGAQEDVAGLAIKLGMAKVLKPDGAFLMLDEPTSAMSNMVGSRTLAVVGSINGQVITVTHKENELASAANVVELV